MSNKNIKSLHLFANDKFNFEDGLEVRILEPDKEMLMRSSPNGKIGESNELASAILHIKYKDFDLLLTGDAQTNSLQHALDHVVGELEVLQIPHHGSATGFTGAMLKSASPKFAVISVGKNNKYGHPYSSIIKALADAQVKILRTDHHGSIEIVSDGINFWAK